MTKNKLITTKIKVKENKIGILRVGNINYISLTDLAKYQNSSAPSFTIKNWLRRINTIDYIGLWEQINNGDFNLVEFDQIKTELSFLEYINLKFQNGTSSLNNYGCV